jgi:hypothetical protein
MKCKVCNLDTIGNRRTCSDECLRIALVNGARKGGLQRINNVKKISKNASGMTYIYTLSDENGDIKYVGKSDFPLERLKSHLKECKKQKTEKEKWIYSLKCTGRKPVVEILDYIQTNNWQLYEMFWIDILKSWGYNLLNSTSGGEGSDGFRGKSHTIETKIKCSLAGKKSKGTIPWNKGIKLTKFGGKKVNTHP